MLRFLYDNNIEAHDLLIKRQRECMVETMIPFNPVRKRQVVVMRP